ncbi:unnamed protein product [Medioppia subpectinata]|uniref:Nuclear receptor domain-containing protein n=1 Tax=Medioppia subpectinata TaxID=1979941 RepID=A0A7R9PZ85_9ACAR|nr:unnamed protein product [Medioppia subpectinata]CAG2106711.1 unnamed protein product [Medioppia subpectinata]
MVKHGCIAFNLLKASAFYKREVAGLYFPMNDHDIPIDSDNSDNWVILSLESITGLQTSLFKFYFSAFVTDFDSDIHILELIMPVLLFNPDLLNIINRERIEQQQQLYLYLLQKYLRVKYGNNFDNKYEKYLVIKVKKTKFCDVCGDEATGYNFGAIACQSCKSFFRRNAFNYETYKCRYNNDCIIDQKYRKICKTCRLKKCFAVGMKKEWILNEEERESRRYLIEVNRKMRTNDAEIAECVSQMTAIDPNVIIDVIDVNAISVTSPDNVSIFTDVNQTQNTGKLVLPYHDLMKESAKEFEVMLTKLVKNINNLGSFQSMCLNDKIALVKYGCMAFSVIMSVILFNPDLPNIINRNSIELQQQLYLYKKPMAKPMDTISEQSLVSHSYKCKFRGDCIVDKKYRKICKTCRLKKCFAVGMKKEWILNEEERESRRYLIEFNRKLRINVNNRVDNNIRDDKIAECITISNIDPNEITDVIDVNAICVTSQDCVTFFTDVNQTQNILCLNDQIAMVKSGCMALKILIAGLNYKREVSGLYVPMSDRQTWVSLPIESFLGQQTHMYNLLMSYFNIMPVMLLNPNLPNIINRDSIFIAFITIGPNAHMWSLSRMLTLMYIDMFADKLTSGPIARLSLFMYNSFPIVDSDLMSAHRRRTGGSVRSDVIASDT